MLIPGKKQKTQKKSHKKPQNPKKTYKKQKTNQNLKIIAEMIRVMLSVFPSANFQTKKNNNYRIVVKNTVVCFFLLFPAIYLCHLYVTICINLRQTIFKIHVKLLVQEIYSPSRGEDYIFAKFSRNSVK